MSFSNRMGNTRATEASLAARIVRVQIRDGRNGMFYAFSDDIQGLVVAEASYADVMAEIPKALQAMYAACGEKIIVVPAQRGDDTEWVKLPAQLISRELEAQAVQ